MGRENVGVFLFEDLVETPDAYYRDVSRFLGIDADETCALVREQHFNERITQGQLELIRKLESSIVRKSLLSCLGPSRRRTLLELFAKNTGKARVELPEELRVKIVNSTRQSHRWLAENYNLPLEKHGYPL